MNLESKLDIVSFSRNRFFFKEVFYQGKRKNLRQTPERRRARAMVFITRVGDVAHQNFGFQYLIDRWGKGLKEPKIAP